MMFLLVVAAVAVLYLYVKSRPKWNNLPPGPRGIPWLGNAHQMEKLQHVPYSKWAREFGPVYMVTLAGMKVVVISDYKMVKEAFSDTVFSGRPEFAIFDAIPDGTVHGLVNTSGDHWEQLRRFSLRQLRDFGFGKNSMEDSIMVEVNELIENLKTFEGKSVEMIKNKLLLAVVNSLWAIVTGHRHKQTDEALVAMSEKSNEAISGILDGAGAVVALAPWLSKVIPEWSGYSKIRKCLDEFTEYFKKPINDHLQSYNPDYQRDFIDRFIQEIKRTTDKSSAFYEETGFNNLVASLSDLYSAGSDTTSSTLAWMVLYLTKFPEVQKKLQDEIHAVTGNTRSCSVADRLKMPYTEAVITETARYASITPMGVAHRAIQDHEFHGFMIPKDTMVLANIGYIHCDPAVWGDPENFRPERFLSPDGKTFKKHDALMPFSTGRRQCLGEALARDSLFLFSTNLFQRFDIEFDKNGPDHGFEPVPTFVLAPKPFSVILKDRLN